MKASKLHKLQFKIHSRTKVLEGKDVFDVTPHVERARSYLNRTHGQFVAAAGKVHGALKDVETGVLVGPRR